MNNKQIFKCIIMVMLILLATFDCTMENTFASKSNCQFIIDDSEKSNEFINSKNKYNFTQKKLNQKLNIQQIN